MIDLQGKNKWVKPIIEAAGHNYSGLDGVMTSSNDVAVQAIIDGFNPLPQVQAEAIKEIAQYASDLIDAKINPLTAKRQQADALLSASKNSNGKPLSAADTAKLDTFEASMIYPDKIFAQYDIEEAAIMAQTDFKLIDIEAAKVNLDAII